MSEIEVYRLLLVGVLCLLSWVAFGWWTERAVREAVERLSAHDAASAERWYGEYVALRERVIAIVDSHEEARRGR